LDPQALMVVLAVQAGIGGLIGRWRGRPGSGVVWGLLLGPVGWIVTAMLKDMRPKCPDCGGVRVEDARKCRFCGTVLA
jgi:hypothetical protein